MNLIDKLSGAPAALKNFFEDFVNMIATAIQALQSFYDTLDTFDKRIVAMVDNCGASEFDGMPVVKAIATYHYVVGDVVFYLIYIVVLFGCLWTIFKIVLLMYKFVRDMISQLSGGVVSSTQFSAMITKLFKL